MAKQYLNTDNLEQVWGVIDARDSKIVSTVKALKEKVEALERDANMPMGDAYSWSEGAVVKPVIGDGSEISEEEGEA